MDAITSRVHALYNDYPYPGTPPQLRADSFPRLLLTYLTRELDDYERVPTILDAGCGTGAALLPIAELEAEARIVALDLSATALEQLGAQIAHRGLHRVRAVRGDILDPALMDELQGEYPDGFDVIYASGVIHHLADPERGLAHLARLLHPRGVLSLMVYGHYGRLPVTRVARAVELARPGDGPTRERVAFTRELVRSLGPGSVTEHAWNDGPHIGDVELVDRYLHVNARSYTVAQLFDLVHAAGLELLRWLEPRLWSVRHVFGSSEMAEALAALAPLTQYQVIENLFDRRSLEVLLKRPEATPAPEPTLESIADTRLAWNPQVSVTVTERALGDRHGQTTRWAESVRARVRAGPELELSGVAAALLQACREPRIGRELVSEAVGLVFTEPKAATRTLLELVREELLYPVPAPRPATTAATR